MEIRTASGEKRLSDFLLWEAAYAELCFVDTLWPDFDADGLRGCVAEFWRRGTTRVTLDVDSENATGAVALYERVGMHVEACGVAFEKANE